MDDDYEILLWKVLYIGRWLFAIRVHRRQWCWGFFLRKYGPHSYRDICVGLARLTIGRE